MKAMLDDVLQFVRLDAAPEMAPEPVDRDAVLAEVRVDLAALIESTGPLSSLKRWAVRLDTAAY